jgi:CRISPR system Cascade subunit CasC
MTTASRFLEIDALTAYPASCLVRDQFGRPKTETFGGVLRGRVSAAAIKRALRTSEAFAETLKDHLGVRTRRAGIDIIKALEKEFGREKAIAAGQRINQVFGKIDEQAEAGVNRQLAFLAPEELEDAKKLAQRIADGEEVEDAEIEALIGNHVKAIDIAFFGRMFADMTERRMTAAVSVQHPFTVGRAVIETDYYVAKDDRAPAEEPGAGFMGNQEFTSGLYYGYWCVDTRQLLSNLGHDADLARRGLSALIKAIPVVSPTGKSAAFGSMSRASWMMVRAGVKAQGSLAAAFLKPVSGDDQLSEANRRLVNLASALKTAYRDDTQWAIMDVPGGAGTVAELVEFGVGAVLPKA